MAYWAACYSIVLHVKYLSESSIHYHFIVIPLLYFDVSIMYICTPACGHFRAAVRVVLSLWNKIPPCLIIKCLVCCMLCIFGTALAEGDSVNKITFSQSWTFAFCDFRA